VAVFAVADSRTDAASTPDSYSIEDAKRWPTGFERPAGSGAAPASRRAPVTLAALEGLYHRTVARAHENDTVVGAAFAVGDVVGQLGGADVLVTAVLGAAGTRESAIALAAASGQTTGGAPAVVVRSMHRAPDGTPTVHFTVVRAATPAGVRIDPAAAIRQRISPRHGDVSVTDIVFGTSRVTPAEGAMFNPWLFLLE
jgi:hypothetical protein